MVKAKKRFGQHFLIDKIIVNEIVANLNLIAGDVIVEIGPGRGDLTVALLAKHITVIAIEIDRDMIARLQQRFATEIKSGKLQLYNADILSVDLAALALPKNIKICGNLPYNISTEIIFKLCVLEDWQEFLFMLQAEVANRLVASHGNKQYGRLSVMTQYHAHITNVIDVSPDAFMPPPKVHSKVTRFLCKAREDKPLTLAEYACFVKICRLAFNQRRKLLVNALKPDYDVADLSAVGISSAVRAEEVSVLQYIKLAKHVSSGEK